MYGKYFNIDETAFSIAPNPKYLFLSEQHKEALAHLLFGVTRPGGFVLITGEIGTGKTTVCRSLFLEVPENTDIALIVNPKLNPDDLLASICDELQISYPEYQLTSKTYLNKLNERLIQSHSEGKNTILIVDEAQNLSVEALETIRVLTNLETDEQKLLQIILIGQPELRDRLNSPEMEQLNQRITARFHLHALNKKETKEYLLHRLKVANSDPDLFSNSNIKYIYKLTGGVPRLINVLCDRALLGAFVQKQRVLSNEIIRNAAIESLGEQTKHSVGRFSWLGVLLMLMSVLIIGAIAFLIYREFLDDKSITELDQNSNQVPTELVENKNQVQQVEKIQEETLLKSNQKIEKHDEIKDISNENESIEENSISSEANEKVQDNNLDEDEVNKNSVADDSSSSGEGVELTAESETINQTEIVQDEGVTTSQENLAAEETQNNIVVENDSSSPSYWAYQMLFASWGLEYTDDSLNPCKFAIENNLFCFSGVGDVAILRRLNRPVILKKNIPGQDSSYLFVKKVERGEVIVLEQSKEYRVSWEQIADSWQGDFELLWKPLTNLEFIRPGRQGDFVEVIDRNLSVILNREPRWEDLTHYDPSLVEEVRLFQLSQKIAPDGVIGPLTQIYMNNLVNIAVPKLR